MNKLFHMRRREAVGFILGIVGAATWAGDAFAFEATGSAFRDEVLALARRRYPDVTPTIRSGSGQNDLLWGDHHLYLDNLYAAVDGLPPAQRELVILDWLRRFSPEAQTAMEAARKATNEWSKAKPLLRAKLLPRNVAASYNRLAQQPFSPNLVIAYALDLGETDLYVMKDKLAAWSVAIDEVHTTAITNLERMSVGISLKQPKNHNDAAGKAVVIRTGDGYDASRLLLPAFRARMLEALGPSLRAGVPGRDALYVWTSDFANRHLIEDGLRRDVGRLPHPLSDEIFAFDAKGVRLADPRDL